jgi:hypothetical protein
MSIEEVAEKMATQKRLKAAEAALTLVANAVMGHKLKVWTPDGVLSELGPYGLLSDAYLQEEKAIRALAALVQRLEDELEA